MSERATEILTANSADLLRYFRRRADDADAADLLGETLLTAWRRIAALPTQDDRARMWLFGIAHNVLLNHSRGRRRRDALVDRLCAALTTTPSAPLADSGVEVRDAIARLDGHLAEIVRLVHWEGFTLVEVAAITGTPASTVRNHYDRAKRQLRATLEEEDRARVRVGLSPRVGT